eukprot:2434210-Pleurochrysis_carterae.AAC.2
MKQLLKWNPTSGCPLSEVVKTPPAEGSIIVVTACESMPKSLSTLLTANIASAVAYSNASSTLSLTVYNAARRVH